MKNIWIDLTDLLAWKGSFTGIQRVLYSYAVRFNEIENVHFFAYDKYGKRIVELPISALDFKENQPLTKRQLIKKRLLSQYAALPPSVQSLTKPALRRANFAFRKLAAMALDKRPKRPSSSYKKPIIFTENDVVLLIGAGWNESGLIELLIKLKSAHNFRIVQHLNDVLPIYQPHLFADELPPKFKQYTEKALGIADLVTVISQASARDVINFCKQSKLVVPNVEVVRLGEDLHTGVARKPSIDSLAPEFILAVGTFEIRKNYMLLYQALKLAQSEGQTIPQIVIVGKRGWLTGDLAHVIEHDPDTQSRLLLINGISDEELGWLYENAKFTIFPSISEGWGLPVAESLQHGKFCLASGVSSMPEIAGELLEYFSPYDARELLELIIKYIDQPKLIEEKEVQIKAHYKPTSWDESFEQMKAVLKKHGLSN
jgi:glycosyltransferase involved in cell wall biosynthesis